MKAGYGVRTRKRETAALKQKNASYACAKCGKKSVKRSSNGIWNCGSCKAVFAGGAYAPRTRK